MPQGCTRTITKSACGAACHIPAATPSRKSHHMLSLALSLIRTFLRANFVISEALLISTTSSRMILTSLYVLCAGDYMLLVEALLYICKHSRICCFTKPMIRASWSRPAVVSDEQRRSRATSCLERDIDRLHGKLDDFPRLVLREVNSGHILANHDDDSRSNKGSLIC